MQLIDPREKLVVECLELFFVSRFQFGDLFSLSPFLLDPIIFLIARLEMDFLTRSSDGFPDFPI